MKIIEKLSEMIDEEINSQYILSQMGRYVAWAGSGSPATTASAG